MSPSSTPKMKTVVDSFNKMSAGAKSLTVIVGTYVVTIGLAVLISVFAIVILILMGVTHCTTMIQALVGLWVILAAVFLTSVVVVGLVARKIYPGFGGRLAVLAVYGVAMLVSYACFAFGLMVAFNC